LPLSNFNEITVSDTSSINSAQVFQYQELQTALVNTPLAPLAQALPSLIEKGLSDKRFGDLPKW